MIRCLVLVWFLWLSDVSLPSVPRMQTEFIPQAFSVAESQPKTIIFSVSSDFKVIHTHYIIIIIASRLPESEPYCCSGCLYVCLSVGHSATYSLPRLTDHNQIWYAGTYLSSDPCKPFWTPCLPYFGS